MSFKEQFSKDKAVNMSLSKRVHAGKWLTCFEAGLYISATTALLISTAFFLWHPAESKSSVRDEMWVCNDSYNYVTDSSTGYNEPNPPSPCNSSVNVYDRFTTVLQLYFAFFVI